MDADSGSRGEDECRQLKERLHSFMGSMRHFVTVSSDDSTENTNTVIIKGKNLYFLHDKSRIIIIFFINNIYIAIANLERRSI